MPLLLMTPSIVERHRNQEESPQTTRQYTYKRSRKRLKHQGQGDDSKNQSGQDFKPGEVQFPKLLRSGGLLQSNLAALARRYRITLQALLREELGVGESTQDGTGQIGT